MIPNADGSMQLNDQLLYASVSRDTHVIRTAPQRCLNIAILNCRSLLSKVLFLNLFIDIHNCDLLFLSKTWLCEKTTSSSLSIPGFQVYRKDRSGGRRAGGVMILVKNNLPSCQVELDCPYNLISDICCVDIQISQKNLSINLYLPPRTVD